MATPPPRTRRVPFPIQDELIQSTSTLPANHFLSQRPVTPPAPDSVIAERYWSARARPDTSSLAAADYDVSVQSGFLPPEEPVQRLGQEGGWAAVEDCLEELQLEVRSLAGGVAGRVSEKWRESVRQLKQPSADVLATLPLLRRAHLVLSFLSHGYIHSTFPSLASLPAPLAVPWVQVSDRLGIPPILNYADTVLWNWKLINKDAGLRADNLAINTTFTSSPSERAFFLLSLLAELYAPNLLRLMSATLDESFFADQLALPRIANYLTGIAAALDELTLLMRAATKGDFGAEGRKAKIDPATFYWEIRPWFNGGKWVYEGVTEDGEEEPESERNGKGKEMEWGGPSAGQSSLVHAVDLFLGVDHSPRAPTSATAETSTSPKTSQPMSSNQLTASTASMDPSNPLPPRLSRALTNKRAPPPISDSTFMIRASQYMPSHHRAFLQHLSALHTPSVTNPRPLPSIRHLAQMHETALGEAYNVAIGAMKRFRDEHMKLATVFIVSQARREPGRESVFWPGWEEKRLEKEREAALARESDAAETETKGKDTLMGTGGTSLVTFLKECRNRTLEAILPRAAPA